MAIFKNTRKEETRSLPEPGTPMTEALTLTAIHGFNFGLGADSALRLSTVWRCVNLIADSIAQMKIDVLFIDENGFKKEYKEHPTYNLLNRNPNRKYTKYVFIKMLLVSTLVHGNGYAIIERDDRGNAKKLVFVRPEEMLVTETQDDIIYTWQKNSRNYASDDVLHLKMFSKDGVTGISPLQYAAETLSLAFEQETSSSNYYRSGFSAHGILKTKGVRTEKQKQQIRQAWQESQSNGAGNGLIVLDGETDYQPLGASSAADSRILDARAWSVNEICRIYGVPPAKVFSNSTAYTYNGIEAASLDFLSSLVPYIEMCEAELLKLYLPSEREHIVVSFRTEDLLRIDKAALTTYYGSMLTNGVMSINEVRKELNLPPVEGCDENLVQLNLSPVRNIAKEENINQQNVDKENQ